MSNMQKYIPLAILALSCMGLGEPVSAAGDAQNTGKLIKCWKNDIGIRECGQMVPPEYSQQRIELINEHGLVVKVIEPPKTREQLEKEREQEKQRKAEAAAKKEQARQDAILLNSYTTERDLIIARDTNLKAAQAQIDITEGNLKMLQSSLDDMQSRAGDYERSGHKPPKHLVDEIDKTKRQIADKETAINKRKEEKAVMEKRFAKDLARFRKLKGIRN